MLWAFHIEEERGRVMGWFITEIGPPPAHSEAVGPLQKHADSECMAMRQ